MFTTWTYCIHNKKTGEYSHISTYSPLEGEWIGWGTNPDGSSAEWDIVGIEYADIHMDYGTENERVFTLNEQVLRRLCYDLNIVFRKEME